MKKFKLAPLSPEIGAEIAGLDLSAPPDDATWTALNRAFLEHQILVFRDQHLTVEGFERLAERFGPPGAYPFLKTMPGHPAVTEVIKEKTDTANFGGIWHTDTAYLEIPPKASLLYALEVPPVGGDTLFANMYTALETLSPAYQTFLSGLTAINRSDKPAAAATRVDRLKTNADEDAKPVYEAHHPAVRTHPETGRKSLFVNVGHTVGFDELSRAESDPLLDHLFAHQTKPEFQCRLQWQPGTLALWDNRCTLHNALNDYHGHRRHLLRITIEGDRPV